jgi:hypothetical protein
VPGTWYTNSTCTTLASQTNVGGNPTPYTTIAAGGASVAVFYRKPLAGVSVAANSVGTIIGNSTREVTAGANDQATLGDAYGMTPWFSLGGALKGFFISSNYRHANVLVNVQDSGDLLVGGRNVGPAESQIVFGVFNSGGFNGEDMGILTKVNGGRGLAVNKATSAELVVADISNYRIRTLALAPYGTTDTIIGAGRLRNGFVTDSTLPAPRVMLNAPTFLNIKTSGSTSTMYYADAGNFRVRAVDLKTGLVSTVIGTSTGGDGNVDNQDPLAVLMRSPQGLVSYGSALLYMDQTNNNCLLRAYNPTASTLNIFGGLASIHSNSVSTIAGNLSIGCQAWAGGTPNFDGISALAAHLTTSDGIASDGTNVYFASSADHCIIKMDATGKLYQFLGLCGTAGAVDGLANTAIRFNAPTAIAMDPDPANAGNFFLVDQTGGNTSRIRYVNFRVNTAVTISGVSAPGATAGAWAGGTVIPNVKTIYSGTAGGVQRWNTVAAWDKWICFTGGQYNNADQGGHNITCKDRNNLNTTRFGLDETQPSPTTRAGSTLGTEQEGIDPTQNIQYHQPRFNGPYGLIFDSDGNLYFAERGGHLIRMIKKW